MLSFWTLYLGPVLLRGHFQDAEYYHHFIRLVRLLTICLAEIEDIDKGFVKWVEDYEEYVDFCRNTHVTCLLSKDLLST